MVKTVSVNFEDTKLLTVNSLIGIALTAWRSPPAVSTLRAQLQRDEVVDWLVHCMVALAPSIAHAER